MIKYTFNNELKILETHFNNEVYLNEVLDYINALAINPHFPKTLKILTYAETATFKFTVKDLESINNNKNDGLVNYNFVMDAIIIDGPETAAISVLYEAMAQNETYKFKVFSTKKYALNWLLSYKD